MLCRYTGTRPNIHVQTEDEVSAGSAGTAPHLAQGGMNAANGLQDALIGIANLPMRIVNTAGGYDAHRYMIPSPDWRRRTRWKA